MKNEPTTHKGAFGLLIATENYVNMIHFVIENYFAQFYAVYKLQLAVIYYKTNKYIPVNFLPNQTNSQW